MRMYDYNEQYIQLEQLLEEGQIDQQTFEDTINSFEDDWNTKAENMIKMYKNIKAECKKFEEEEKRIKQKKQSLKNSLGFFENQLDAYMQVSGQDKADFGTHKLSYRKSKSVNILDESLLPDAYFKIEKKVQKTPIKQAILDGEEVPGAEIIENKNLQIK